VLRPAYGRRGAKQVRQGDSLPHLFWYGKPQWFYYEKPLWFNIGKPFRFCIGEYLLTKSLFGVVIEKWVSYN
jgi:hypothetical protein